MPARFPDPRVPTEIPDVVLTGHDPTSRGAEFRQRDDRTTPLRLPCPRKEPR